MDLIEVNIKVEPEDEIEEAVSYDTADPLFLPELQDPKKDNRFKPKPKHPQTAEMVNRAIMGLYEKNGSSIQAIKKYMVEHYGVDVDHYSQYIKRYLRTATANGLLKQTSGRGAHGKFKITGYRMDPSLAKVTPKPRGAKKKVKKKLPSRAAKKKIKVRNKAKKSTKVKAPTAIIGPLSQAPPMAFSQVLIKEETIVKTEPPE